VRWSSSRARGATVGLRLLVSLVFAATTARAAAGRPDLVILLAPTDATPAATQSLRRIKDEVAADRFDVVLAAADAASGTLSPTWGAERGTLIVLFGDPATGRAELCVFSRTNEHTAVRRAVVVEVPEKMPEVLASRALELLRATALELSVEGPKTIATAEPARPATNAKPRAATPAAAAEESTFFSVESGLVVVQSLNGPPPALVPLLRLDFRIAPWLELRTSAAGLGTQPRVETAYGSASVSQTLLLLELVTGFIDRGALRPFATVGGGALHVGVSGAGVPPYVGQDSERWSASVDAGVGLALAFRSHAAAVAELHCLVASPHPSIRFVDSVPATIGYPSLMLTLALQVTP